MITQHDMNTPNGSTIRPKWQFEALKKNNFDTISFVCNHGKHRSVGWAEILKKYYYHFSKIKHIKFKKSK